MIDYDYCILWLMMVKFNDNKKLVITSCVLKKLREIIVFEFIHQ